MGAIWITPVTLSISTSAAWTDIDVSASIPVGATGVILHYTDNRNYSDALGLRKNGSTDNRYSSLNGIGQDWQIVGVDENRVFEYYTANKTNKALYLVGYFTDDANFFTNAIDFSLTSTGSFQDIDISGQTGDDQAVAAIINSTNSISNNSLFRQNGSTDFPSGSADAKNYFTIVGVDDNEIFEMYITDTNIDTFLMGYFTSGIIWNTNQIDISTTTVGSWTDITTLPPYSTGAMIFYFTANSDYGTFGVRKNGATGDGEAITKYGNSRRAYPIVSGDTSGIVEGVIGTTNQDFYLRGIFTGGPGGPNYVKANIVRTESKSNSAKGAIASVTSSYAKANIGTKTYYIYDWYDLDAMRDATTGTYYLMNDLDSLTDGYDDVASSSANSGAGWLPIPSFTGSFYGQNYTIDGLYIDRTTNYCGLFGTFAGSYIFNLGLTNVDITTTGSYAGALVGSITSGTIDNCYSTGALSSAFDSGGLIGTATNITVNHSYSTVVTTAPENCGGFIANIEGGVNISNSYATGNVTCATRMGGFVGRISNSTSTIYNCYSEGATMTSSTNQCGGFAGGCWGGTFRNCHTNNIVNGVANVGGFIGVLSGSTAKIYNCHSTGNVTVTGGNSGGLIGVAIDAFYVSECSASGDVAGYQWIGGFCGYAYGIGGIMTHCVAHGNASGASGYICGGFLGGGANSPSFIDCYTDGGAQIEAYVGGFFAYTYAGTVTFVNCYSAAVVTHSTATNSGFAATAGAGTVVTNCFWDTEVSTQATSPVATGKTTAEMKDFDTFDGASWDIVLIGNFTGTNDWYINDSVDYPRLDWEAGIISSGQSIKANVYRKTFLVSPLSGSESSPVYLVWTIPSWSDSNLRAVFQVQVDDTDDTFSNLEANLDSRFDSGFEYHNGSGWVSMPVSGVISTYFGNQARVQVTLGIGTKYWRARAGVS